MANVWEDVESLVNTPSSFLATDGERGTIKPKSGFDAEDDAATLRNAIEGLGTHEETLIDVLTHRSSAQRQLICEAYQSATGKTLLDDLKGDTDGEFQDLLVALITPPATYDCHEIMRAMKGIGAKCDILIEIFASRSAEQVAALNEVYLEETEKKLTFDLKDEVSGDFGEAVLLLAGGERDGGTAVEADKAKEDAKTLYEAGEKKWGTDESKFIDILCRRNIFQLRQILVEYTNISDKTLQEIIKKEMSEELMELLVAIVKCVKSVPLYLAERLHDSMKGLGTDECTLNRIIVSRSEIDLQDIKAAYKQLYEHSLQSDLESDLGGSHADCAMAICGGDD